MTLALSILALLLVCYLLRPMGGHGLKPQSRPHPRTK